MLLEARYLQRASSETYADTLGTNKNLAVEQVVRQIRVFLDWSEPEELKVVIEIEDEGVRKEGLLDMNRNSKWLRSRQNRNGNSLPYDLNGSVRLLVDTCGKYTTFSLQRFA